MGSFSFVLLHMILVMALLTPQTRLRGRLMTGENSCHKHYQRIIHQPIPGLDAYSDDQGFRAKQLPEKGVMPSLAFDLFHLTMLETHAVARTHLVESEVNIRNEIKSPTSAPRERSCAHETIVTARFIHPAWLPTDSDSGSSE